MMAVVIDSKEPFWLCYWNNLSSSKRFLCTKRCLICVLVLFISVVDVSTGATIPATRGKRAFIGDKVQSYLMKFGYLPYSDMETGNLRSDSQLKEAIKNLQTFAKIPVTGELDPDTESLLKKPRCGVADIVSPSKYHIRHRRKRYTLQGQSWEHTDLTWSLKKNTERIEIGLVRNELRKALDVWARASKLTFREVSQDSDADIIIVFQRGYHNDGYPFDGPGQILAHAFFPGSGRGGDAHFDEDEKWVVDDATLNLYEGTSLFAVAAHEFGHSLGLSHSSKEGALMNPWYQTFGKDFELPADDRYGIQQIYGAPEGSNPWAPLPPLQTDAPPKKTSTKKPTEPRTTPKTTEVPAMCDTSYDAISVIRGELFIFKGRYFWRIGRNGLHPNYAVVIDTFWYGLPRDLTHVDAVYERPDGKIMFFIGQDYWEFKDNTAMSGFPKSLTTLGIPADIDHIDGAMVWGHNQKTYLFSGTMYWRLDEDLHAVELDYPRDMSMWRGVPYGIDAVLRWTDGKTYFFKGKVFWKFDDLRMRVTNHIPSLTATFWMGCPIRVSSDDDVINFNPSDIPPSSSSQNQSTPIPSFIILMFSISVFAQQFL